MKNLWDIYSLTLFLACRFQNPYNYFCKPQQRGLIV